MAGGGGGSTQKPINPDSSGNGTDCESISFTTNLSSPEPDVLEELSVGETLILRVDKDSRAIIAIYEDKVAGSISHYRYTDLINCIEDGHSYIARIRSINQGLCKVSVFHV